MSRSIEIRIILWIYLLNITAVVVRGQVPLPNAVIEIKGQTMLDCHSTIGDMPAASWRHSPDGTNLIILAVGCNPAAGNDPAYYKTELIGGNICRLTIANVTMQQAGVYICYNGATTWNSLITVIDPVASVVVYNRSEVVEDDQLTITCSINYNGPASPAPSLRPLPYWTTSPGQNFTSAIDRTLTNVVTLTATVTVQKTTVPVFLCKTVFEITGNTNGYNPVPPADNFTVGNTTELDVKYMPSTPAITSKPEVIAIDGVSCGISVLTCSSTGNPIPNYRWFDSAENVILTTADTLTLAEVNRNYRCEAYNTIRNQLNSTSTTTPVSTGNCGPTSTVQCCVFPRDETTSVTVDGCDYGTLCDCSQGNSGIILTCNAKTFPNASYIWSGPNGHVTYSPIYDKVTMNGTYRSIVYFNESLTNYTGDVKFPNGTNETTVERCSQHASMETSTLSPTTLTMANTSATTVCTSITNNDVAVDVAIAMGVLFGISLAVIIILVILLIRKQDLSKRKENIPEPQIPYHSDSFAPAAYEELRRIDEINLQPTTYEQLTHRPPMYANDIS